MQKRKVNKKENIKQWKKGINNVKAVTLSTSNNQRGGLKFT